MGLFDQILGAIDSPNQQASPDQIGGILGTVQQLASSQGMDANTTQMAMSVLGGYVRSALQQQRQTQGVASAEAIVNQYGGTSPNPAAVQALFGGNQQNQVVQAITQRTGIPPQTIQMLLPVLVPLVLNLLKTGASTSSTPANAPTSTAPTAAGSSDVNNSVLSAFLDADGDGDVDVGDAMRLAGQFMNRGS
jgi:hypothetical protein